MTQSPSHNNNYFGQQRQTSASPTTSTRSTSTTSTSLYAIGVLAKKAKEIELRKYAEAGIPEDVMAKVKDMKAGAAASDGASDATKEAGPVQRALTKRKGTIAIIAEYKRRLEDAGFVDDILDPDIMGGTFREFGASAISVMADERMGGASYADLALLQQEQQTAKSKVPGPVPVISSDLIVDELQLAMAAAAGAQAVLLNYAIVGTNCATFIQLAAVLNMETIVGVATAAEAQAAVDAGATMILACAFSPDDKLAMVENLVLPENSTGICKMANIVPRENKQLEEVEEAWLLRDKGFNAVWAGDFLYKSGADANEHAGAIIRSMSAKSSVKFASAKATSGRGEGATEYLGDLMM
jgi:indole-3-glycerol phosphate synthase